jgi:glycine oxidase
VQAKDAIVVGGGIIGCSIALRLADSGFQTTIIERGTIGCEASRAAAGMLSPQASAYGSGAFFDLCMQSLQLYPGLVQRVHELSGIDPEYQGTGTICVALGREEQADIDKWCGWQIDRGLRVEKLSVTDLRDIEPSVSEEAVGGVKIPGDHQIENRRLMDAMDVAVRRAGVEVVEGRPVDSLLIREGRAAGVISGGQALASGTVILAAGAWSGPLAQDAGLDIPIIPARGQMLAVRAERLPFAHVIHAGHCYLVPRRDNRIVIGSTIEYAGFKKATTVGGLHSLLEAAIELVPSMKDLDIVESWSGLRPDTPDHLPVIGSCGLENLYVATGHFRNGILLAPITAELILKCVIEGSAPREITPFGAARFSEAAASGRSGSHTGPRDR